MVICVWQTCGTNVQPEVQIIIVIVAVDVCEVNPKIKSAINPTRVCVLILDFTTLLPALGHN